ncbi:MAG TPA: hypothetical protein VJG48_00525, partial [Candidatus Paceibacterota bacterium]
RRHDATTYITRVFDDPAWWALKKLQARLGFDEAGQDGNLGPGTRTKTFEHYGIKFDWIPWALTQQPRTWWNPDSRKLETWDATLFPPCLGESPEDTTLYPSGAHVLALELLLAGAGIGIDPQSGNSGQIGLSGRFGGDVTFALKRFQETELGLSGRDVNGILDLRVHGNSSTRVAIMRTYGLDLATIPADIFKGKTRWFAIASYKEWPEHPDWPPEE